MLAAHGDDDQIVPIAGSALLTARLLPQARLRIYHGAPHGLVGAYQKPSSPLLDYLKELQP